MTQFLQFLGLAAIAGSCWYFGAVRTAAYAVVALLIFAAIILPAYWDKN